jgi:hypothetical protein
MSLSSALWRPTSSRSSMMAPVASNNADACSPPVAPIRADGCAPSADRTAPSVQWRTDACRSQTRLHAERLSDALPHTAARCRVEIPLQAREVDVDAGLQLDLDDVAHDRLIDRWTVRCGVTQLRRRAEHALREQKSDGELDVVPRRAHRDRDAALFAAERRGVSEPDFEGRFRGEQVGVLDPRCADEALHGTRDTALWGRFDGPRRRCRGAHVHLPSWLRRCGSRRRKVLNNSALW